MRWHSSYFNAADGRRILSRNEVGDVMFAFPSLYYGGVAHSLVTADLIAYYPAHDAAIAKAVPWVAGAYTAGQAVINTDSTSSYYGSFFICTTGGTSGAAPATYQSGPFVDSDGTAEWTYQPYVAGYDSTLTLNSAYNITPFADNIASNYSPRWSAAGTLDFPWLTALNYSAITQFPSALGLDTAVTIQFLHDFTTPPYRIVGSNPPYNFPQGMSAPNLMSFGDRLIWKYPDGSLYVQGFGKAISSYGGLQFVTVIYDPATNDTDVYIGNRQLLSYSGTAATQEGTLPSTADPGYLGAPTNDLEGILCGLVFYSAKKSPAEIAQNYAHAQYDAAQNGLSVGDLIPADAPLFNFIADSIGVGLGCFPEQRNWAFQLIGALGGHGAMRMNVAAASGYLLAGEAPYAVSPYAGLNGDDAEATYYSEATQKILWIELATNDIEEINLISGTDAEAQAVATTTMVNRIASARANGYTKVVANTLLYYGNGPTLPNQSLWSSYNTALKGLSGAGAPDLVIDFASLPENVPGQLFGLTLDLVHPCNPTNTRMAQLAIPTLIASGIVSTSVPVWPSPLDMAAPALSASTATVGTTLTVTNPTISGATGLTYYYQWSRTPALLSNTTCVPPWQPSETVTAGMQRVSNSGGGNYAVYTCATGGVTSATGTWPAGGGPTGTGTGITDGGATWNYVDVVSPNTNYIGTNSDSYTVQSTDVGYAICCECLAVSADGTSVRAATLFCRVTS
jgi:hypothetical protein